ncbi:hypothetical protein BGZ47_011056 [Haplosporangium gracile]|nr:hypothetical protein BGZ47_011056 [Haplosporangium gracile]
MSTSLPSTQNNPQSQYPSTMPSSPEQEEVTDSGKRIRSPLKGAGKIGRRSTLTTDISSALQRVQDDDSQPLGTFSGSTQLPFFTGSLLLAQGTPAVENTLQTLQKQRLADYSLQAKDDTVLPLMERVQNFLAGDGQVMLILGDSGAGKSTFNRHLEYQLWQDYKAGGPIPLFINLPALDRPDRELVAEHLRRLDFLDELIWDLKQSRRFWSAKLVVTCRSQYLGRDYRDQFVPKASNQYQRAANNFFQEAVIAPFSTGQIEDYVERYVPLEPRTWVKKDYMDKLTTIPNLLELAKNPFLLTLCLEALPNVVHSKSDLSALQVTRVQLYDIFVMHWLDVNKRRLQDQTLSEKDQSAFNELKDDVFEKSAIDFQKDLAAAIFIHQDGRPIIEYTPKNDKDSWKKEFFRTDPRITLLHGASLLSRAGNQFRFVHRSILEYFYSYSICPPYPFPAEFAPLAAFDFASTLSSVAGHPLSQRNLVTEPSIVQFLAQRAQMNPDFRKHLHALLEQSKTNVNAFRAAANAITILVRAGVRFNGADLRGLRIQGADLSGGQFDSAQFQGANLEGVNLAQGWIRQADFRNARMDETQFGELPYLKEVGSVRSCAYSSDGRVFVVGLYNGDINMYDTATWKNIRTFKSHQNSVRSLSFLPCNSQFLSSSWDEPVRLWDCETGASESVVKDYYGPDKVVWQSKPREYSRLSRKVMFSPCGKLIASVSDLGLFGDIIYTIVRQWSIRTLTPIVLSSKDRVFAITYSSDSKHIALAGKGGVVRIFDTQTGLHTLELVCRTHQDIGCVTYSPDGKWIIAGTRGGSLHLCEARNDLSEYYWTGHESPVSIVSCSLNGQWIASCSMDNFVKLWSTDTRALVSVFIGHFSIISSLVFSPDGLQLTSSSHDGTVRFWKANSIEEGLRSHSSSVPVSSVAYSPDGQRLVFGAKDGSVRLYNANTGEPELVVFSKNSSFVKRVAFSSDGLRIAGATAAGQVTFWDVTGGSVDTVLDFHRQSPAFSPCGNWIATSHKDNTVRSWDACSGQPGHVLTGHTELPTGLSFSPDGSIIVSGARHGSLRSWELSLKSVQTWGEQSGKLEQRLVQWSDTFDFALSSCGGWIAAGFCGFVSLWNYAPNNLQREWKQQVVVRGFVGNVITIAWRPSVLEFVTGSEDNTIRVWKLKSELGMFSVHLVWSSGPAALVADGALIVNTVSLSTASRQFLKQRGALDESSFAEMDDDEDKELLLPEEPEPSEPREPSDTSSEEDWNSEDFEGSGDEEPIPESDSE